MLTIDYIEDLKVGDIVVYSEQNHLGLVDEINTNLDDNDEEYLYAVIRWFDGHNNTVWEGIDFADGEVKVMRG